MVLRLGSTILSLCIVTLTFGAELFEVPTGTHLRSLHSWENSSQIQVRKNDQVSAPKAQHGVTNYLFDKEAVCNRAGYRQKSTSGWQDWKELSRLCLKDSPKELSFAFISDTQQYHAAHTTTAKLLGRWIDANPNIRFVINAGDIVQTSTMEEWKKYRTVASENYSSKIPIIPVVGNHEYRKDSELKLYNKVYGHHTTENRYYALEYEAAAILVLNSNIDKLNNTQRDAQTQWLEAQLKRLRGTKPILVSFHHAPYSSGGGVITMPVCPYYIRKHWEPLFQEYGVNLVLSGHEHVYERLLVKKVPHLVAGPAGGKIGKALPWKDPHSEKMIKGVRTISIITVSNSTDISISTYDAEKPFGASPIDQVIY